MVNFYASLVFFCGVAVALLVYRALAPLLPNWLRQVSLLGISAVFLFRFAGLSDFWRPLGLYLLVILGLGELIAHTIGRKKSAVLAVAVVLALDVLIVHKYSHRLSSFFGLSGALEQRLCSLHWVGLSYLSFKVIDYCIAMRSGKATQEPRSLSWLSGASYFLFFPAFVSGPINRFEPYLAEQTRAFTALTWARLRSDLIRISLGIIKILFFGEFAFVYSVLGPGFREAGQLSVWMLGGSLYSYYLYLYFDFSGYCDVAIALADLFEVRLPENFRYPFLASSPQDFWNRWHISLSQWMRDMVFFRLLRILLKRFPRVPYLIPSMFSIFVTFALVGVWHGDSLNWLLYGCYHGLALALGVAYQSLMDAFCPDFYQRLTGNWGYRLVCVFLTFNFVAWGLLLTQPLGSLSSLFGRLAW